MTAINNIKEAMQVLTKYENLISDIEFLIENLESKKELSETQQANLNLLHVLRKNYQ